MIYRILGNILGRIISLLGVWLLFVNYWELSNTRLKIEIGEFLFFFFFLCVFISQLDKMELLFWVLMVIFVRVRWFVFVLSHVANPIEIRAMVLMYWAYWWDVFSEDLNKSIHSVFRENYLMSSVALSFVYRDPLLSNLWVIFYLCRVELWLTSSSLWFIILMLVNGRERRLESNP